MFITAQSNSFKLLGHWFYNTKNSILNNEVLLIQISYHGGIEQTLEVGKTLIRTIINEEQEKVLEDSRNCFATKLYSIYVTNTTNIPDIIYENNRNIILISSIMIDIKGFDRPILSIPLEHHNLNLKNNIFKKDPLTSEILHKLINNLNDFSNKPYINEYEEAQYYLKQLPLLQMMRDKKYEVIGNYIYDIVIHDKYKLQDEVFLKQAEYPWEEYNYKALIISDIKLFVNQKILTERLSIVIYRICFWKFNEDISLVNQFYNQKLGLGKAEQLYSNNLNLNFVSQDLTTNKMFKGYDLRNLEEKQIKLAKEIIKTQHERYESEFDKETIHEVTCLSYEQINQLILQGGY